MRGGTSPKPEGLPPPLPVLASRIWWGFSFGAFVELSTFNFDAAAVRVQVDDLGQPWFNATDVCDALGMGNPSQAIKSHVDAEDLQKLETLSAGGNQLQNHINESGLYSLIMGSRKPEAKRFKRWVTSEVLPSIRKTGAYVSADAIASPIQNGAADLLFKSVEAGITPKSQANLIVKAMALSSAPGAADILAALERQAASARAFQAPATTPSQAHHKPCCQRQPQKPPATRQSVHPMVTSWFRWPCFARPTSSSGPTRTS